MSSTHRGAVCLATAMLFLTGTSFGQATDASKSLEKCQKMAQKQLLKYSASVQKAIANCLEKIAIKVVKGDQTVVDVSGATATCLGQFYKIGRTDGKSIADKLTAKVNSFCDPADINFKGAHVIDDVMGGAPGVNQPLNVATDVNTYCGRFGSSATTMAQWLSCMKTVSECQARQQIATTFGRALEWLNLMDAQFAASADTRAIEARAALQAVETAIDGTTNDNVPEIVCGTTSPVLSCGNGTIESPEQCDGVALGGADCTTQGWFSGTLACTTGCAYDVSGCTNCGNGLAQTGEQCDGSDLNGQDCTTQGFFTGTLACTGSCTFDTAGCSNCGNNVVDVGEICDGTDLNAQDCTTQGFFAGTLACNSTCDAFDTGNCFQASVSNCAALLAASLPGDWPVDNPATALDDPANVCGESDPSTVCFPSAATFAAADSACSTANARLCTVAEAQAQEAFATGCAYDTTQVWTLSACTGGHLTILGDGTGATTCTPDTSTANTRCCGDVF